jgi:hypothetical protein
VVRKVTLATRVTTQGSTDALIIEPFSEQHPLVTVQPDAGRIYQRGSDSWASVVPVIRGTYCVPVVAYQRHHADD